MAQPLATTTPKKSRRVLPEPIEISSRSSKKRVDGPTTHSHKHLGQASTRNARLNINTLPFESGETDRSFQPGRIGQLAGRTTEGNDVSDSSASIRATSSPPIVGDNPQRYPRKFTPQLMETARHSFRPCERLNSLENLKEPQREGSSDADRVFDRFAAGYHTLPESRFSYSSLLRRQETRRHSFRVPDLPAIPSSGSEDSIELGSAQTAKQSTINRQSNLLESLAPFPSQPSEYQLKEQALAAFPNEQVYQPVDHFAIDKDEEESPYEEEATIRDSRPGPRRLNRRASSADLQSELEYLRRHKEEAGMNRRHYLTTRGGRLSPVTHRIARRSWDRALNRDQRRDLDRPSTRSQFISPPMLGRDLIFPQSVTPETTICEGNHVVGGDGPPISLQLSGLWSGSPCSSIQSNEGGLWNGTCKMTSNSTSYTESLKPGLVTPRRGFEAVPYNSEPANPPEQISRFASQASRKEFSRNDYTDQEFSDSFVTQIYDYLSLGYPSVARYYDYELSKVSGIPVTTLRADDLNADAKGHVGMHATTAGGAVGDVCARWTALRLYIEEWARQRPRMLETDLYHETWGVRERKGSWAV